MIIPYEGNRVYVRNTTPYATIGEITPRPKHKCSNCGREHSMTLCPQASQFFPQNFISAITFPKE